MFFGHQYSIRQYQKNTLITNLESLAQADSKDQEVAFAPQAFLSFYNESSQNIINAMLSIGPSFTFTNQSYNLSTELQASFSRVLGMHLMFKTVGSINNSFGTSPKYYLLGGTSSDLGSQYFARGFADYRDPMFFESLYGVRGFRVNYRNGNTAMFSNFQLDWQIVNSIFNRPITSDFFSNITLRSFIDLGTSFYGRDVFDKVNVLSRKTVTTETGSIIVNVNEIKNPFLGSFGLGLGSKIFGYAVSLDAALGYESQFFNEPMLHLNLGRQF